MVCFLQTPILFQENLLQTIFHLHTSLLPHCGEGCICKPTGKLDWSGTGLSLILKSRRLEVKTWKAAKLSRGRETETLPT